MLCSPSTRTRVTWEYAAAAGMTATEVWYDRRIYTAGTDELLDVLHDVPAEVRTVILVGHGPGVPWLADELTLDGTSPRWSDLAADDADLVDYVIPRG